RVNWTSGLDAKGRPMQTPQPDAAPTFPGSEGATNWYSPSYSPRTGLFYVSTWADYSSIFYRTPVEYTEGRVYAGGMPKSHVPDGRAAENVRKENEGYGAVRAIDPNTGERRWE